MGNDRSFQYYKKIETSHTAEIKLNSIRYTSSLEDKDEDKKSIQLQNTRGQLDP